MVETILRVVVGAGEVFVGEIIEVDGVGVEVVRGLIEVVGRRVEVVSGVGTMDVVEAWNGVFEEINDVDGTTDKVL